jgi:hypothetical protein
LRATETSLGEATGHDYSVCYALAFAACPIALWVGNLAAAADYAEMLLGHSRRHGSPLWAASGSRFHKIVALKCGVLETKSRLPRSGPNEVAKPSSSFQFLSGLSELERRRWRLPGGSLRDLRYSKQRSRVLRQAGSPLSCCASKVNFCCCRAPFSRGNAGGSFPAGTRRSAPARGVVLGVARCHEPCSPAARPGPHR